MNLTASAGPGRALEQKGARRLQDLVRAPQLADFAFKLLHALALGRSQAIVAGAGVGFGLADPQPQRLALHSQIAGDMSDRPAGLKSQVAIRGVARDRR
jgi:hypothetical protein